MENSTNDPYLSVNRLVYNDKHKNVGTECRWMEQMVRDKLGKNKSWAVAKSWADFESKSFKFECVKNAHEFEIKEISFADAPEVLGWKSMEFEADKMHIVFEPKRYAENIGPDGKPFKDKNGSYWHVV